MRVSIVGTGYVGLVSGACLADRGHQVICVDVDARRVAALEAGEAPIHEAGLPELLERVAGRSLRASTDLQSAVLNTDMTLIAVGTPARDGQIDLTQIGQACMQVGMALRLKFADRTGDHGGTRGRATATRGAGMDTPYHVVAVKSTVIPGTTDGMVRSAIEQASGLRAGIDFGLGMNPEFLTEGQAVDDFMHPDRIVLGGIDARTLDTMAQLYERFEGVPVIRTNSGTAEMIKYASNALLATLISFSNELGRLCSALDRVDIAQVMHGVHESAYLTLREPGSRRVPAPITGFLEAGCGFGGSCLPKDVTALLAQGRSLGVRMPMLAATLQINEGQPEEIIRLITRHYPSFEGLTMAVLGLAFRPGTDDTRASPAFPIIDALRAGGAHVIAHDPVAHLDSAALHGVSFARSMREAVIQADVVVLVTRWPEYLALDEVLGELGHQPLVVDGRRVLPPERFTRYEGIGRRGA